MNWSYTSGIFQGIVVNIKRYNRRNLFSFIDEICSNYNLKIEIITNDDCIQIYDIDLSDCFIYIQRRHFRDDCFSYSYRSSNELDDFGEPLYPIYFKSVDIEFKLNKNEEDAFEELQNYFDIQDSIVKVYEMGVVEY